MGSFSITLEWKHLLTFSQHYKEQLLSTQPRGLKQELGKTRQKNFKKNIIGRIQKLSFPVTLFLGLKESEGKCK